MKKRAPRLGQHFLRNPRFARELARAAKIVPGDTVVEIGPGKGALTRELLAFGGRVIAIEKDEGLVRSLKETFAQEISNEQLQLIEDDVRNFDPGSLQLTAGSYVVAANIPYYITGEIVRAFLTARVQPCTMALLVQKEVAERIVARDEKESILSISVKAYGAPKVVAKVPRGNFSPPPQVDSAILIIENISRDFFNDIDEESFFRVIRKGFSSKRKFLLKNLAVSFQLSVVRDAFRVCNIPEKARAEDVPLEAWKCLAMQLSVISSQISEKTRS